MLTPKRLALLLATALCFVFGFVGYVWLMNIDQRDVYAFHDVETWISPRQPLRPGDVVELDGAGEILPICHFAGTRQPPPSDVEEVYFNRYFEDFQSYVEIVRGFFVRGSPVQAAGGGDGSSPGVREVVFRGKRLAPDGTLEDFNQFEQVDCDTRMARVLLRGSKVCTVVRSILEVRLDTSGAMQREVVALQFKEFVNVPETALRSEGVDDRFVSDAYKMRCSSNTLPLDVILRDYLSAIGQRQNRQASSL